MNVLFCTALDKSSDFKMLAFFNKHIIMLLNVKRNWQMYAKNNFLKNTSQCEIKDGHRNHRKKQGLLIVHFSTTPFPQP